MRRFTVLLLSLVLLGALFLVPAFAFASSPHFINAS